MPVIVEQDHADVILVHVERDPEYITGKLYQLIKADARKTRRRDNTRRDVVIVPTHAALVSA